ncbi:MAG: M56 family metallopeptidase [Bacteroidales bacterium]|nr:M56 family metallopeptidase [Bacteroidales bacterium]MDD4385557.1 M56 family metallopeptidase [Bacteroidales bacterium]
METASIFSILLKWSLGIAIVWGVWFILLKRINQFRAIRFFIAFGLLFSMLAPLLTPWLLRIFTAPEANFPLLFSISLPELTIVPIEHQSTLSLSSIVFYISIVISSALLFRLILNLIKIFSLAKAGKIINRKEITIIEHTKSIPPFSFFRYCFINPSNISTDKTELIVAHEIAHKKHYHSIDAILLELIGVIQWYNPFYWILKKVLIEIHEYQADGEVIAKSADSEKYMDSIVSVAFNGIALSLGNNFNKSLTIKRLAMMNTKKVKKYAVPALALSFMLAFSLMLIISCDNSGTQKNASETVALEEKNTPLNEEVFIQVENMPKFKGDNSKEQTVFRNYINENLIYPKIASENGIAGKVFVSFIIETDGTVSTVKVVRGVDPSLDKESIRVVESSPKWEPGTQKGKNVRVHYTMPITFSLE